MKHSERMAMERKLAVEVEAARAEKAKPKATKKKSLFRKKKSSSKGSKP